jgi:cytidylate kinase
MMGQNDTNPPVITIDGPSGSGKGTISQILARRLGWHFLDSGVLYRVLGLAAENHALSLDDAASLVTLAGHLDVQFQDNGGQGRESRILLEGEDITEAIRSETCGEAASRVAALPDVRRALLERQRAFQEPPGLVADGRDMGTVVFPHAVLKIFLTASPDERANRRYKQLKEKGKDVNLRLLREDIAARDARDAARQASPLKPAEDAVVLDTTEMDIDTVVERVLAMYQRRQPG